MNNGFQLTTASDDNSIKVWDLRKKGQVTVVPAHNKLISDVKFDQTNRIMLTSSYDGSAKVWAAPGYTTDGQVNNQQATLLRTLAGHENKVTSVCATSDMKRILTTSFDRTFKLWEMKSV